MKRKRTKRIKSVKSIGIILFTLVILICSGVTIYNLNNKLLSLEEENSKYEKTVEKLEASVDKLNDRLTSAYESKSRLMFKAVDGTCVLDIDKQELITEIIGFNSDTIENVDTKKWFYYNSLSDNGKELYMQMLKALLSFNETVHFNDNYDKSYIYSIMNYVMCDNPTIFWCDDFLAIYEEIEGITIAKLKITYDNMIYSDLNFYNVWCEIKEYRDKALEGMCDFDSDYSKELQIFNYIILSTRYCEDSYMNQSIYSVVQGKSVCAGMSKMFKFLCDSIDIDCICVFGKLKDGGGHLWNMVKIDNTYKMVDVTNGGGLVQLDSVLFINYTYFNCTAEKMEEYYIIYNKELLPKVS